MSEAVCENGHKLAEGASRCECGARIKMQWMSGGGQVTSAAKPTRRTTAQRPPAAPATGSQETWIVLGVGSLVLAMGIALIMFAPEAAGLGYLLGGLGGVATQVAIIALGVRLGMRD